MKYLIFCIFVLLLIFSQTVQAQEWEELTYDEVFNNGFPISRSLLDVAVGYVIQKGKFESTKAPFPGSYYESGGYYENGHEGTKVERRNTSTVTYYRYNFLITESFGPSVVNATAVVSYNPSNSNFRVTSYHYNIDYNGNESPAEENKVKHFSVDTRDFTGDGDLASDLRDAFNSILPDEIENGDLPDDDYTITYVYGATMTQFPEEENNVNEEGEINEEEVQEEEVDDASLDTVTEEDYEEAFYNEEESVYNPIYRSYEVVFKAKSSEGKYYLVNVGFSYGKENGEYVFDKDRSWGGVADFSSN